MSEESAQLKMFSDEEIESTSYGALLAYPRQAQEPAPFIKRLWIRNLKGFENLEIQFAKFNVLVGPNNCGKSTILQAIDLCFRLIQFHAEYQRDVLVKPRAGKRVLDEMLPVADPEDFWFRRRTRVSSSERIPVTIGVELEGKIEFEFEIRRLWGTQNSRMTRFPEGLSEKQVRSILARRPTLVPSSVGVVAHEEWRAPARLELLSLTGHHNEVLRNNLSLLSQRDPSIFQGLQDDLRRHFGGTVCPVSFDLQSDQYITVNYEEHDSTHDIFSAGGGFLQILQLLTYLYLQTPGIALLDEPDAHLHSSLQRLVIDLLDDLNKRQKIQIVIATHSKEIINYVDASWILPISRNLPTANPLEHHASVLPILQDLGAIDNSDLAALISSKRCVFVEGATDKTLLAHFAAKLKSTVFEGQSQVVVIPTEGIDHPGKYISLDIFERVVGKPISAMIIRDSDGLPDDLIQEIRAGSTQRRLIVCLSKTHIENYLLLPSVIWRVICEELRRRGTPENDLPSEKQVENEIEGVVNSLYDQTFDSIAAQVDKHHVVYRQKHLDASEPNRITRAFLSEHWKTFSGKLSVVIGKEALRAIRRRAQELWKVSFSNIRLVEAFADDEIAPEIKSIITKLEAL
jgi:energy-coupling factor transporter ATP-binding protein EcfA2